MVMTIESGVYSENERKKRELTEKERQKERKKIIEAEKTKEYIKTEIETEEKLYWLQELVEAGYIDKQMVEQIIQGESIEQEAIQEIFDKIDQISDVENIAAILPSNLRITKQEYLDALSDKDLRELAIWKLESALWFLSDMINPDSIWAMSLFSSFFTLLDKNLILVQENTIDVKKKLLEIDKPIDNWSSVLKKIINYFK